MRQFTQRLMMVVMATFMAVGSLWATDLTVGTMSSCYTGNQYGNFDAGTGGTLTVTFKSEGFAYSTSKVAVYLDDHNGSYGWAAGYATASKTSLSVSFELSAGMTYAIFLSDPNYGTSYYGDMDVSYTGGAGSSDGPDEVSGAGAQGSPYIIELGKKMPCGDAYEYIYYQYTATSNGRLMFDMSKVSSSTSVGYNTTSMTLDFSYWLYNYQEGISLSAGQSAFIFIGYNANNSENYVKFSFETLVEGETPASAISLSEGTNSGVNVFTDKDTWYKISVPANHKVSYSISTIFFNTNMYAGLANAEAKANAEADSQYSAGVASGSANNVTAGVVDYYIYVESGFTFGSSSVNITITFEDLSALNNAKSIGTPAFNVANNANVATSTPSILVTFPNFKKGSLDDYNVKINVNMSTGMNNIYSFQEFSGTANGGVSVPVSLEDGKVYRFEVAMTRVDDYLFEHPEKSIQFTAVNVPDGTEGNPFIITEEGVAGPKAVAYGSYVWYKYVCPSDGMVTISHTWANASVNTTGFIRVNGEQVRGNVPDSWSYGKECHAGDVIMVAMATESAVDSYLVKGSVSAPGPGDVPSTAITLNEGNNSIAKVENGAMSRWYKFNLAANFEATLTFNGGVAAKYYIGSPVNGTNISNNEEGNTELQYTNDGASAVDVFIEVTGTNTLESPSATLSWVDNTPAPVEAPVFTSALNNGNANGGVVAALENAFFLQADATVGAASDNSKFHLMKDDMWLADAVLSYDNSNQAAVIFEGSGFSENGVYKVIVDAGAATIGGEACGACEFVWTIGGAASDCDADMADASVAIVSAKNGEDAAGGTITMMSRDFELTCDAAGLTRLNSSVGVKLEMPWNGGTYDITSYIRDWQFDCDKITFTLSYNLDYSLLSTAGDWKLYIYEKSFVGETDAIYSDETTFTWTVAPAVVYNNPTITAATNSGEAAGSKVTMLSEDFYITLSEASNYAGYGVNYQFNGIADGKATVNVSMNAEGTVATVNVSGADLTREGEHSINVTYGAFINAHDEYKVLTAGQKLSWYLGDYAINAVSNNGNAADSGDEIDNKMFKNEFDIVLNYPSSKAGSDSYISGAKLQKDGVDFLTSNAKATKMDAFGKEWRIEFTTWIKSNGTYVALEPGVYTLVLPAGAFTNDIITSESTAAYSGSWTVSHVVYPWPLVTTSHTTPVLAGSKTPGSVNEKFSHVFNVTFDGKYSNVAQGAGAITLDRDEMTIAENPVVVISGNTATITFGDEDFGVDGTYTLNIAEGAFTATYTQDGDDTPSNNVNNSSSSFTWNVTVPAVVYNAPNIVSATNGGNVAGTTVNEVAQDFIVTLSEESTYADYGVYYQFSDDETAPVTDISANVSVSMNAGKTLATIHVESAKLSLNGRHVIYITAGAFVNANDETKALATGATFTWTREGVETFDVNLTADGYASFCWDKNWTAPVGVTVYIATGNENDMVFIEEVSGVIPANAGVILYALGESQVTATATSDAAEAIPGNILIGTTVLTVNPANTDPVTVYAMHCVDGTTVFDSYVGDNIPANKAYLKLGAAAPARLRVAMAGNTTTGMEAAATVNGGVSKRLVNGQLFILRDGKMYNVQGVKL